ncbi:MAG: hypothetical protein ACHQ4H_17210 [Ktedonobacterales bacterium]
MPRPRWREVRHFCLTQGYVETVSDHWYYDKMLPGAHRSHTKVSFGHEGEQVPARMWKLVWFHELRLASEDDFWRGLKGETVAYDVPPSLAPPAPLPDYLVRHLRDVRHYTTEQIAATTPEEAQALLNAYYSGELAEPDDADATP